MRILLVIATLIIAGCSATQGLSFYTLNNEDVAAVIKPRIPELTKNTRILGLSVALSVNDLNVNIGPENRDVVALAIDATANINAFAFEYPVRVTLGVEGSPFYDSEKKAVFIRDVNLLDSSIDAGGFKGNLGMLDKEFMALINAFLADTPVYELDLNKPKVALLAKLPLNIEVVEGAIKLVPRI